MENANRVSEDWVVDFFCCILFEKEYSRSRCGLDSRGKGKIGRHRSVSLVVVCIKVIMMVE